MFPLVHTAVFGWSWAADWSFVPDNAPGEYQVIPQAIPFPAAFVIVQVTVVIEVPALITQSCKVKPSVVSWVCVPHVEASELESLSDEMLRLLDVTIPPTIIEVEGIESPVIVQLAVPAEAPAQDEEPRKEATPAAPLAHVEFPVPVELPTIFCAKHGDEISSRT